ncbi:MAG: Ig-like domain-containing protein, partial [Duncaniella sp.]|nr:Ig-like domain-containing protein [Duncaniella sp.]
TRYISRIPDHLTFEVLNLYPDYDYPRKRKSLKVASTGAADADKTVTVEIEINNVDGYDDSASDAYVRLTSPLFMLDNGTYGSQFVDLRMYPVDDTGHKLQGSVTISKYSKSGHWTAGDIIISDNQGYQRFEGQNDCVFDLYVNNSLEDTEAPKYGGDIKYTISDTIIEGHNAQNLEVSFKASDNIGFQRILCRMQFPGSTYCNDYDGVYSEETGECIINIPVTEYFRTGDYYLSFISLIDIAGNNTWYNFSMDENDYPIETIHIVTADPDTTNPEIDLQRITVYAEPTHPEAPDGETLVTVSFYARDDKSGFDKCSYTLRDPQGTDHYEYFYHRNFGTLYFDGDPTVWEHYLIKVVLPQGSAPGIWGLARMTAADKAFNEYTYNFVETLIFEPDNDSSDYELFADIEDSAMVFGINSQSGSQFSYKWRIIHEESGLEISGTAANTARTVVRAASENNQVRADLTGLPKGDLILIVEVHGEDGKVHSVKSRRVAYEDNIIMAESITLNPDEWLGNVGDTFKIVANVLPEDASDKSVVWNSSDENIATVDESGTVTVIRAGSCLITASTTDGSGLKAECSVMAGLVGIDTVFREDTGTADVYNLQGMLLKRQCDKSDINSLTPGIYIIRTEQLAKTVIIK